MKNRNRGSFYPIPRKGMRTNYGWLQLRKSGVELFVDYRDVKGEVVKEIKIK